MTRIVKPHDERRTEILDVANRLFISKGYAATTVNDILGEIGIAKGTFYHYFESKEQVLEAINDRFVDLICTRTDDVMRSNLPPSGKLLGVFMSMSIRDQVDDSLIEELHRPENALMHEKMMRSLIDRISPVLADIVRTGVDSGEFSCPYPLEYMQIILSATLVLTDENNPVSGPEAQQRIVFAVISLLESALGVEPGRFLKMYGESLS